MIWDGHCHLYGAPGGSPEERIDNLVRVGARLGIERLLLSMGTELYEDPSPEQLRRSNDEVLRAMRHAPAHALGLVYLNPRQRAASVEEFDRCVREGPMVGVKLWVAVRCSSGELDPIVERAAAEGVPIYQHTWDKAGGNLPGESMPSDLAALARRHPRAAFVCGHTGGDWARSLPVVRDVPNVWADLSGSDPTAGITEAAVRELGAARVLFGSDAGVRSFASQIGKVQGAALGEGARTGVLRENLRGLLAPVLRRKGLPL